MTTGDHMESSPTTHPTVQDDALVGPLQVRILRVVWNLGRVTVHQVADAINAELAAAQRAPRAYTTYLTVMRNLARRGLLKQDDAGGRAHWFTAEISEAELHERIARYVLDTYFDGDLGAFVVAADAERAEGADAR
jgi:predicted transcriptional regulator